MSGRRRRGRPKGSRLTDSAKKEHAASHKRKYRTEKTRLDVWVSNEDKAAWEEMKRQRNIRTNTAALRFLLDLYNENMDPKVHCDHEILQEPRDNKKWLEEDSVAHRKLTDLVLDSKLLRDVPLYLRFRNTSCNEVFNSIIGAYVPKRVTYRPPGYRARCLLAAIDYQANHNRPVATTEEGEVRLHRKWLRRTKHWDASPVKAKKDYSFISTLIQKALVHRLEEPQLMQQKVVLEEGDPRRLSKFLSPESTKEIYAKKQTRL